MDANTYFRSLTAEITALKDRIRNFKRIGFQMAYGKKV